jgi:hypothetical protein
VLADEVEGEAVEVCGEVHAPFLAGAAGLYVARRNLTTTRTHSRVK